MALKDKLMTLEDFKAVRDVDVASNSAQFAEIKSDLSDFTEEIQTTVERPVYTPLSYSMSKNTVTRGDITFAQDTNKTISVSGTATSNAMYTPVDASGNALSFPLIGGKTYRLSGCPSGGNNNAYRLDLRTATSGGSVICTDTGDGIVFTASENSAVYPFIRIGNGQTVNLNFVIEVAEQAIVEEAGILITSAIDTPARERLDKVENDTATAIRYDSQSLTDNQKEQARENIGANAIYLIKNKSERISVGNDSSNVAYHYWGNGGMAEVAFTSPDNNLYYAVNNLIPVNPGDVIALYDFGMATIKKTGTPDQYSVSIIGMYDNDGNDAPGRVDMSSEYVSQLNIDIVENATSAKSGYGELKSALITIPDGCTQIGLFYKRQMYDYISQSSPKYEILHDSTTVVIDNAVNNEFKSIASEVYDEKHSSNTDSISSDYYLKGASSKLKSNLPLCIIGAGQSNIDGRNPVSELPSGITLPLSGMKYIKNNTSGVFSNAYPNDRWSFDLIVCNELIKNLGADNLFYIKWSQGGTSIDPSGDGTAHWTADYENLSSLANSLLYNFDTEISNCNKNNANAYRIGAMIWHQGESDRASYSQIAADNYYINFKKVIAYCRGIVGNKLLPFICGTVPTASGQYDAKVDAAIRKVAQEDDYVWLVDLANAQLQDGFHFNAEWSEYFGKKVFDCLIDAKVISGTKLNPSEPS